jgi:ATP-binding cassette subfamily B protein
MLKRVFRMTDEGYKNLKKAIVYCVVSNIILILPAVVILELMQILIAPLRDGGALDIGRLWLLFGAGGAAAVLYAISYAVEYDRTYTTAYKESTTIRLAVAEHMRKLPLSFFNRKDLAELTTNIMADCTTIEGIMSHAVPQLVANCVSVTLICALLTLYDWRMSLALFCTLPVAALIFAAGRRLQAKMGERHVKAKLAVSGQVQEYLEGVKVIKAFGFAGEKFKALDESLKHMMKAAIAFESIAGSFVLLASMILQVGSGIVIFVGITLLTAGSLDVIALLIFVLLSARVYSPFLSILGLLPELLYSLLSSRRMQILREEPAMTGDETAEFADFSIEMKNVSFAYNENDVIKNFSLRIPQNGVTALVGPSGSGKTTISRLIARFWDVREGEIQIGGRNIREIDPERLMSYMGFVFQDVVLFNDTVMNNIRIGKHGAADEEVYAAAKAARCDGFVRKMPRGYETVIGENGSTLSGGERQRISIARALLKNAPIVLLDEATASLDPENETQVQAAISELVRGRTVIVIAHRLRTVMGADKIVVLDNGRLVEQGTGERLIAENGLFARMYKIQQESLGWGVGKE